MAFFLGNPSADDESTDVHIIVQLRPCESVEAKAKSYERSWRSSQTTLLPENEHRRAYHRAA
jgi:hypothetical protein